MPYGLSWHVRGAYLHQVMKEEEREKEIFPSSFFLGGGRPKVNLLLPHFKLKKKRSQAHLQKKIAAAIAKIATIF